MATIGKVGRVSIRTGSADPNARTRAGRLSIRTGSANYSSDTLLARFVVRTGSPFLLPALYDCPDPGAGPSLCGPDYVLTWVEKTQTV